MTLDPTNHRTWIAFEDHPIFSPEKSNIEAWSHDSTRYCDLDDYGRFWPDHYVHIDPPPSVDAQKRIAKRDIANLASACERIETAFGHVRYELVVLDDFTAYVWISHARFTIEIYPDFPDENTIIKMFIDTPDMRASEHSCRSVQMLLETLSQLLGTEQSGERERD